MLPLQINTQLAEPISDAVRKRLREEWGKIGGGTGETIRGLSLIYFG